jgi:hypothetical protein
MSGCFCWSRSLRAILPAIGRSPRSSCVRHWRHSANARPSFSRSPRRCSRFWPAFYGRRYPAVAAAPLVLYSGLLVVVLSGEALRMHRQRMVAVAGLTLLFLAAGSGTRHRLCIALLRRNRPRDELARAGSGALRDRCLSHAHRQAARIHCRRRPHCERDGAREPRPAACFHRCRSCARALGRPRHD